MTDDPETADAALAAALKATGWSTGVVFGVSEGTSWEGMGAILASHLDTAGWTLTRKEPETGVR